MNPIQNIAPIFATHAANSLFLGLAISVLAWFVLRVTLRGNSAVRFAVLYSALLATVALLFFRRSPSDSVLNADYSSSFTLSAKWAVYLLYLWAIFASAALMRIAAGLWRLHRLRSSFVRIDLPELHAFIEQCHRSSKRRVEIFQSPEIRVPAAIGFFRPAVVLPSWSLEDLSAEELKASIVHELAHVDRWDDWTNLGQKLIRAVLCFHPAVWWLDSQLAIEREMSCDDTVLSRAAGPESYAQCLISLAEKSMMRRPVLLVHAAVGRMKETALRISKILDGKERKGGSAWKPAVVALAAFSAAGMLAVEHTPQLVAFQSSARVDHQVSAFRQNDRPLPLAIPAAMRTRVTPSNGRRGVSAALVAHRGSKPEMRDFLASNPGHAAIVNARAGAPAEFMYVVMETRDYDSYGTVRVTTSVWRLRFVVSPSVQAESAAPPHST